MMMTTSWGIHETPKKSPVLVFDCLLSFRLVGASGEFLDISIRLVIHPPPPQKKKKNQQIV